MLALKSITHMLLVRVTSMLRTFQPNEEEPPSVVILVSISTSTRNAHAKTINTTERLLVLVFWLRSLAHSELKGTQQLIWCLQAY